MAGERQVQELMVNIFDYPHVPYWFSVGQASQLIKMSFAERAERPDPVAVLVFDEKYNLVGIVGRADILKGMGPESWSLPADKNDAADDHASDDFLPDARKKAERPVSEIMAPVKLFVEPEDTVAHAAFLMVRNGLLMLPVLEGKRKLVGLVRMAEVFEDLASAVE